MKDIVENRSRLRLKQKLRLGALALRENGMAWTMMLGLYGAASAVAEKAHGAMQTLRKKRGIPGMPGVLSERVREPLRSLRTDLHAADRCRV